MRIPLDYYRILGLPIQATPEQLRQAYRDRAQQLPRREYSEAAIEAYKQLLDRAYSVLADPVQRRDYDQQFFSAPIDSSAARLLEQTRLDFPPEPSEALESTAQPEEPSESLEAHPVTATAESSQEASPLSSIEEPYTPSIIVEEDQLIGALLILQELGEYELVLSLGLPYLSQDSAYLGDAWLHERAVAFNDVALTVALAYLELGREQWQQGYYEKAATSLESGSQLLLREALFPELHNEIKAELQKLRPYRVLELLSRPIDAEDDRQRGLYLLQDMLGDRGGIDGRGNDQSGLDIDAFLRFIQQLRDYLTVAEQQNLFLTEAGRPSAVATYLAVYALLARGFAELQPALVDQAKQMLLCLSSWQDVYLELAVCDLLLGQTEEATQALELSREYESLAFIREHSEGAPDLLPGLCRYAESWLHEEVLPHFRDLAPQAMTLKTYFADEAVVAHLEPLPNESSLLNREITAGSLPRAPEAVGVVAEESAQAIDWGDRPFTHPDGESQPSAVIPGSATEATATASEQGVDRSSGVATLSTMRPGSSQSGGVQCSPAGPGSRPVNPRKSQKRSHKRSPSNGRKHLRSHGASSGSSSSGLSLSSHTQRRDTLAAPVRVLRSLLLGAVAVGLGFVVFSTVRSLTRGSQEELPLVDLTQPVIEIPASSPSPDIALRQLTPAVAQNVIQSWLSAKTRAFGPEHAVEPLQSILADPILTTQRQRAEAAKQDGWHWQYQHDGVEINWVRTSDQNPNQALVEATVSETADFFEGEQRIQEYSYSEQLRVQYNLVHQDNQWRIQDMLVIQ